jgi:hypothetical protein
MIRTAIQLCAIAAACVDGTPATIPAPAATARGAAPPATQSAARGRAAGGGRRSGPPVAGPVAYNVQVSMDGQGWGAPIAQGAGSTPATVIGFAPVQARFIRVTQTGTAVTTEQWAIAQVRVFEAGR